MIRRHDTALDQRPPCREAILDRNREQVLGRQPIEREVERAPGGCGQPRDDHRVALGRADAVAAAVEVEHSPCLVRTRRNKPHRLDAAQVDRVGRDLGQGREDLRQGVIAYATLRPGRIERGHGLAEQRDLLAHLGTGHGGALRGDVAGRCRSGRSPRRPPAPWGRSGARRGGRPPRSRG